MGPTATGHYDDAVQRPADHTDVKSKHVKMVQSSGGGGVFKAEEGSSGASVLTVTGGLESECCGEERTTGGIPRAGLVPGPLPPAN